MSHIERKKVKGRYYLYQYQCYRDENGRVKKKLLKYLGSESDHPELVKGSNVRISGNAKNIEGVMPADQGT